MILRGEKRHYNLEKRKLEFGSVLRSAPDCSETLIAYAIFTGSWKPVGCFIERAPNKALPNSFDSNVGGVEGNDNIFEHCKQKAEGDGYKLFGVDDNNCWSGDDAENSYDMYGESSKCSVSKSGNGSGKEANEDMFVYRLE